MSKDKAEHPWSAAPKKNQPLVPAHFIHKGYKALTRKVSCHVCGDKYERGTEMDKHLSDKHPKWLDDVWGKL